MGRKVKHIIPIKDDMTIEEMKQTKKLQDEGKYIRPYDYKDYIRDEVRRWVAMPIDDQTAKADAGKPRLSLVPKEIMYRIAEIRGYGCRKYPEGGENNWKQVDIERYWDALLRHIFAAWEDHTKTDPESGYMHLSHAACNLAFILELIKERMKE